MAKNLNEALNAVDLLYSDLAKISDDVVNPIIAEFDSMIKQADDNVDKLTDEDIRILMSKLTFRSYSFVGTKEKSALKAKCAETLKDEVYAKRFNALDGTVAVKQNIAQLDSSYELLSEIIYDTVSSTLKLKLDEIHRTVDVLKTTLLSRMSEAKLSAINIRMEE